MQEAFEKYERSEKDVEECLEEMEHMRKFHEKDALELDAVRKAKEEVETRLQKLATDYANESQQSHRLEKDVKSLEQQVSNVRITLAKIDCNEQFFIARTQVTVLKFQAF